MDIRPPASSTTAKELFATPILKLVLLPAIIQKVAISLFGAPNLIHQPSTSPPFSSSSSSTPHVYHCNYLFDTGCNRVYPCNFAAMSQLKGATILAERKDDTFSILPSLQAALQSRKRVGESIKVSCTFSTACSRHFIQVLQLGLSICLKGYVDMPQTISSSCRNCFLLEWQCQENQPSDPLWIRYRCPISPFQIARV